MNGEIHVYPYKEVAGNCGFYGLLLSSGTFQPDNIEASRCNEVFTNSKVALHDGATMAVESGTRGIRFGELNTETGSTLDGYYKSGKANSYYIVGSKGTDAILAGRIYASTAGNTVGLVKEGAGTYTISGNDNDISGGIRLTEGRLNIDNDADEAEKKKKNGATGKNGTVFVFNGTTLAGNGNVAARTEIYGTVRPGGEKPGTLHFADYTSTTGVNVTLHPEANIVCLSLIHI